MVYKAVMPSIDVHVTEEKAIEDREETSVSEGNRFIKIPGDLANKVMKEKKKEGKIWLRNNINLTKLLI